MYARLHLQHAVSSKPDAAASVRVSLLARRAARGRDQRALAAALAALRSGRADPAELDGEVPQFERAALLEPERVLHLRATNAELKRTSKATTRRVEEMA